MWHLHRWERITETLHVKSRDAFNNHYNNMAGARCVKCGKLELRPVIGGPSVVGGHEIITYKKALLKLEASRHDQ